jgi:hypothetical protein
MDWQDFASRLVALLLPRRGFAPGEFDAADKDALLAECRAAAATDTRSEVESLRAKLAIADAAFAAEQRLRALGATEQDIETLRGPQWRP